MRLEQICKQYNLTKEDYKLLKVSVQRQKALEVKWLREAKYAIRDINAWLIRFLEVEGRLPAEVDFDQFERLFMEHKFESFFAGLGTARQGSDKVAQLAGPLDKIMKMYDLWRKKKKATTKERDYAKEVKEQYLKKVHDTWRKHSEAFREGNQYTQDLVRRQLQEAARTTYSRAKNIISTETTNYYNSARREYYDQSSDVTHYLFLAIRDPATSKWCTPERREGLRGRHGLVYTKGTEVLTKETPACHWYCRSELLPLTPLNPNHLRLIQNKSIQRNNVKVHPLPRGWR